MKDLLTEDTFQEIIRRRREGVITFSEFLDELTQFGISEYKIDVATGQATYKSVYSYFKTASQVSLVVSRQFNRNRALKAIENISLPFVEFLKAMAEAGIVYYCVNIRENKVIYYGITGENIEEKLKS